jgi:hypothetical protein
MDPPFPVPSALSSQPRHQQTPLDSSATPKPGTQHTPNKTRRTGCGRSSANLLQDPAALPFPPSPDWTQHALEPLFHLKQSLGTPLDDCVSKHTPCSVAPNQHASSACGVPCLKGAVGGCGCCCCCSVLLCVSLCVCLFARACCLSHCSAPFKVQLRTEERKMCGAILLTRSFAICLPTQTRTTTDQKHKDRDVTVVRCRDKIECRNSGSSRGRSRRHSRDCRSAFPGPSTLPILKPFN